MIRITKRRLVLGAAMVGVAAVFLLLAGGSRLELRTHAERSIETFRAAGPLPFFAAMALLPGVGFPLSLFLAMAGPVFGPTMGVGWVVACAIVSLTINVALFYWVAAHGLRPVTQRVVQRLGYRLPEIQPKAAWPAILFFRIVPVTPFGAQNLILGLARVPFGAYMAVSTIVPAANAISVIVLGDALMRGDRVAMAWAGVLFVVVGVVLHILRKRMPVTAPIGGATARDDQRS